MRGGVPQGDQRQLHREAEPRVPAGKHRGAGGGGGEGWGGVGDRLFINRERVACDSSMSQEPLIAALLAVVARLNAAGDSWGSQGDEIARTAIRRWDSY